MTTPKKKKSVKLAKPDNSPQVFQREKINWELKIRELPWTDKQKAFVTLACDKNTKIVFLTGPAGTSKTTLAVRVGLELLNQKKVGELLFTRAAVESADSKLGMLPGDIEHKLGEYMTPFDDKLEELLSAGDRSKLKAEKRLIYKPVNFCRGASWTAKCVVVDEAQNLTLNELQTILTRLGMFSKIIVCADPAQSDLPAGKQGGFATCSNLFDTDAAQAMGIYSVFFTKEDIVRSELCKFVVETFEEYKKTIIPEDKKKINKPQN